MKSRAALLALVLCACGGGAGGAASPPGPDGSTGAPQSDADYFPVSEGASWSYRTSSWSEPASWTSTMTLVRVTRSGDQQEIVLHDEQRMPGDSRDVVLKMNATGISFAGESPAFDAMMDATAWQLARFDGEPASLPQTSMQGTDPVGRALPWTLRITPATAVESITTPAGTFDAKRFEYTFVAGMQDNSGATVEVTHTLTEWRARRVGLVRQVYVSGTRFFSANWTRDLVAYSIPGVAGSR